MGGALGSRRRPREDVKGYRRYAAGECPLFAAQGRIRDRGWAKRKVVGASVGEDSVGGALGLLK